MKKFSLILILMLFGLIPLAAMKSGPEMVDDMVIIADHWEEYPEVVAAESTAWYLPGSCEPEKFFRVVYIHHENDPSRADELRDLFFSSLTKGRKIFENSMGLVPSLERDENCDPVLNELAVPDVSSFSAVIRAMTLAGFDNQNHKYITFIDVPENCGIAGIFSNSTPGKDNPNNTRSTHASVWQKCWTSGWVVAHEMMHSLGAVQLDAPNATDTFHCTDDYDPMCYELFKVTIVCPEPWRDSIFDCNNDDYMNPDPEPGTYLHDHWNVINSDFLEPVFLENPLRFPMIMGGQGATAQARSRMEPTTEPKSSP